MKDIVNALVSEKVMKWQRETRHNNPDGSPYYANYWVDENGNEMKPVNFWSPATDIKDAWVVIDYLRECGILISVASIVDQYESSYDGNFGAHSPSAPIAICIAALKAVGVEVAECYSEQQK